VSDEKDGAGAAVEDDVQGRGGDGVAPGSGDLGECDAVDAVGSVSGQRVADREPGV
jgi:hypothetical protein